MIAAMNENFLLAHASPIPYMLRLTTLIKNNSTLVPVRLLKLRESIGNTINSVWSQF